MPLMRPLCAHGTPLKLTLIRKIYHRNPQIFYVLKILKPTKYKKMIIFATKSKIILLYEKIFVSLQSEKQSRSLPIAD